MIANVEMAAAWDGDEGEHWAAHAERYEQISARFQELLLRTVRVDRDDSILDIGCGTGRSTRAVARRVVAGTVFGVDLSSRMLERARAAAEHEGLTNVRFEQADAQVHPFPDGAFNLAISVFGAMFFADPVAAFLNVRRSLGGEGRLALLAWRDLAVNEWITSIRAAARGRPHTPDASARSAWAIRICRARPRRARPDGGGFRRRRARRGRAIRCGSVWTPTTRFRSWIVRHHERSDQ